MASRDSGVEREFEPGHPPALAPLAKEGSDFGLKTNRRHADDLLRAELQVDYLWVIGGIASARCCEHVRPGLGQQKGNVPLA
jgi:hypothetical protein